MSKGVTKGRHGHGQENKQERKSVGKGGHKKGEKEDGIKPMVWGSMFAGETTSMCKEGAGKGEVTRKVRPQERGSTPEREHTRNKEGESTRRRAEKRSEKVSIKV